MSIRVHVVMSDDLLGRMDRAIEARPGPLVSRSEWIRWAVEQALGDSAPVKGSKASLGARNTPEVSSPAPAEQPDDMPSEDELGEALLAVAREFGSLAREFSPYPKPGKR